MAHVQAFHKERGEWVTIRTFPDALLALAWLRRRPQWGYRYRLVEVGR